MSINKYIRTPKIIEAIQVLDETIAEAISWLQANKQQIKVKYSVHDYPFESYIGLVKLKGTLYARRGDYIVRTAENYFYVCDQKTFEETFELYNKEGDL